MAERLVTHTYRNTQGDILAIGNPEESWGQRQTEWAIDDIVREIHEYNVQGSNGLRRIYVVNGQYGPYLRTVPDSTEGNNLDNLPILQFNPWEVALENSEILAIHAAVLPGGAQGQVLMLGGDEHDSNNADNGDIFNSRLYDVALNEVSDVPPPAADVFCCGHAFLPNGNLFVGGGTEFWRHEQPDHIDMHGQARDHWSGAIECSIYTLDGTWDPAANMLPEPGQDERGGGRWYPTLITLQDGRILAVGGHPRLSDGRHGNWMPEIYNPETNTWAYVGGHWIYVNWADLAVLREPSTPGEEPGDMPIPGDPILDDEGNLQELVEFPEGQTRPDSNPDRRWNYLYYPRMFVVPGGDVFMVSPNDGFCGWYNPNTGLVNPVQIAAPPHGVTFAETNHTAVMLPLLPGDDYTPHFLFFGMQGPHRITLADFSEDEPPEWQPTVARDWQQPPPLRRHGCATLLPTGDVIFTGGINSTEGVGLPDDDATLFGELYSPGINWESNSITFEDEQWTTLPRAHVPRNYHSVALLLPNGRVLTAGSNLDGQSGGDDVKEYRIEIYTPDYFHDVNRPEILTAPSELNYGEIFSVHVTAFERTERVALMRCGSVTHAWDGDQRYVGLHFSITDNGLSVVAPPNGGVAPPGPYMLWVIDNSNRPCRLARFVILN